MNTTADLLNSVDNRLKQYKPSTVILATLAVLGGVQILNSIRRTGVKKSVRQLLGVLLRAVRHVPGVSGVVSKQQEKMADDITKLFTKHDQEPGMPARISALPEKGISQADIFGMIDVLSKREQEIVKEGKLSGKIYSNNGAITELINQVYARYTLANALHADVFSSVRRFEAEIIRMTARIMRGDQDTCGVVTSGGTDSLFMAVKTYRDRALALFGITEPEVVMPVTAHPAFDKAAEYLCVKLVKIDLDPNTLRVDLNAVKRAINRNTILVVGSAPNYPHGVVDDIEGLSQLLDQIDPRHSARVGRIGLHVDSCLGGFVLPWALREGNYGVPTFDFAVARVTSISADTHKYGFAPKGTSVLLFRDKSIREHMFFVATDWSGGIYASPSLAGSRPGALLACTWAVMLYNGDEGYNNSALQIMNTQRALVKAIQDNEHATGLRVLGLPTSPVVAFTFNSSTKLDVFKVNDAMSRRHWHLDALQQPSAVHLCVTMRHVGREQEFMKDLIDSVAEVRAMPKDEQFAGGSAPMYGVVASLPDRSLITDFAHRYLATMLDA